MGTGAKKLALFRGQRVGRYELVAHLARGGMAELYLARASGVGGFEKYVALKKILPRFSDDPKFIRMFLNEARVAATLDHQNIGHVHDVGETDGDYFFTMEYIHGQDLRTILRAAVGKGLPLEHAIQITVGMCAALHYAHEKTGYDGTPLEVVHRDVSPANVLVSYEGAVKVVDFGIARAVWEKTHPDIDEIRKGKLGYMSPEQCRAEPVTRQSDIFSIGILLFEMTTMTRLFRGGDEFSTMNMIVNEPIPRPSSRRVGYPKDLEQIIMKALAREPADRYQTALEMQLDLEEFAVEHGLNLSPTRLSRWLEETAGPMPYPWDEPRQLLPLPTGEQKQKSASKHETAKPSPPEPATPREKAGGPEPKAPVAAPPEVPAKATHPPTWIGIAAVVGLAVVLTGIVLAGDDQDPPTTDAPSSAAEAPAAPPAADPPEPQPPKPKPEPKPEPPPPPEPEPTADAEPAPDPLEKGAPKEAAAEVKAEVEDEPSEPAQTASERQTDPAPAKTKPRKKKKSNERKQDVDPDVFLPPD